MKKDKIVEDIKKFILSDPERPFEEVESYVEQIGGNAIELKEALHDVSDKLYFEKYLKDEEKQFKKTPKFSGFHFKLTYYGTLAVTAFALLISAYLVTLRQNKESNKNAAAEPQKTVTAAEQTFTPIVYASKSTVDARHVFSYPPSDITLKFGSKITKEVFGFFPYWMMDVEDKISLSPYTSISLFGLTVDGQGKIITFQNGQQDPGWQMWEDRRLENLITKAKTLGIKVYLTLKSFNNSDIDTLVGSEDAQRTFISNAVQLVESRGLDGVNIDFEYTQPAKRETSFAFARMIANLSSELKRQFPKSKLSVDTYLRSASLSDFFDLDLLGNYADYIVVMGYDVHTPSGAPGPIAPMEGENGVRSSMQSYIEKVSPQKLILAVPYYGYDWPVNSEGSGVKTLAFAEIADAARSKAILWSDTYQAPYYKYDEADTLREVHFENARSLGIKYDYIKSRNLAGVGIWAIGYDGNNRELQAVLLDKFAE